MNVRHLYRLSATRWSRSYSRFNLDSCWASFCTSPVAARTSPAPGDAGAGPSAGFVVFSGEPGSGGSGALLEAELGAAGQGRLSGDRPTVRRGLDTGGSWTRESLTAGIRKRRHAHMARNGAWMGKVSVVIIPHPRGIGYGEVGTPRHGARGRGPACAKRRTSTLLVA